MRRLTLAVLLAAASPASPAMTLVDADTFTETPTLGQTGAYSLSLGPIPASAGVAAGPVTLSASLAPGAASAAASATTAPLTVGPADAAAYFSQSVTSLEAYTTSQFYGLQPSQSVRATLTFTYSLSTSLTFATDPVLDAQFANAYRAAVPGADPSPGDAFASVSAGAGFTLVAHRPDNLYAMQTTLFETYAVARADNLIHLDNGSFTSTPETFGGEFLQLSGRYGNSATTTYFDPLTPFADSGTVSIDVTLLADHRYDLAATSECYGQFGYTTLYTAGNSVGCTAAYTTTGIGFTNIRDLAGNPVSNLSFVENPFPVPSGGPEPATWALFLAGFGVSGTALRRRRAGEAAGGPRHRVAAIAL